MKKSYFLVLSLFVTFAAFGQQSKSQTVTGKIVDTEGQPISKAKVVLYYIHTRWGMGNRVAQETESGTDGSFTFKDSLKYSDAKEYPYGRDSYVILASHPGCAFGWKNIDREREQAGYEIILTEPGTQTITVTDHDGKPLAGARVWPYSVGNRADSEPLFRDYLSLPTYVDIAGGTTGADGKAIIKNLPKTRSSFNASLKGYATGLSFGGSRPIRLSKGATVSGTILDEDGKRVQGALLKFKTEWMWNFILTRTDSQGKFRLEDLPAEGWDMSPWGSDANANGIYVITIEHKDYIASETQDQFKAGQVVEDFDIEAYRGTLIKCQVVDVKTNLPVAGARIRGSNESGRIDGRTDADGVLTVRVMSGRTSLSFGSPPEGVYVLRGQNPPESSLRFDAQGEEMTVTMKLPPIAGCLTSVKGKVQLPDGTPAANVKISTTNSEYYETLTFGGAGGAYTGTGSDGSFELKEVPAGLKLFIYGNTKDYQYILAEVIDNVEDPTVLSAPLIMQPGQVADVLLADKRDEPCANLSVKVKPVMWDNRLFRADYHNAKTDAEGRLKINGIIPGMKYYVMDSRAESGPRDMYYTQTITLIPLEKKVSKITSFEGIDIDFDIDRAKGRMLLVCFWDMQQRPSRNTLLRLAKRAEELKLKGVTIVAAQAVTVDENALNEWVKKNGIPFPAGMARDDETKTRFTWGIRFLPWLILTDRDHVVIAEGFGLAELDAKIEEIVPSASAPVELNKVTGLAKDSQDRPLSGVRVTEFQTDKDYATDTDGRFVSAFGHSDKRRFFFAVEKRRKLIGVGGLLPGERHVEIKLIPARIVSGTVVDPTGRPVAGAQVAPLPMTCYHVLTDNQGRFDIGWAPEWAGNLDTFFLMARHLERNLAGGIEIDEKAKNVRIDLEPALILAGMVQDPNGVPIPGAEVGLSLRRGWACGTPVRKVIADEKGRYEFPVLLQKQENINYADAEDFWRHQITTAIINKKNDREQVGSIILRRPILSVSGTVLYGNSKVVADIPVHLRGEGQPALDSKTDANGKFVFEKVCCGPVWISAKNDTLFGKIDTEGGVTNLKLEVRPRFE